MDTLTHALSGALLARATAPAQRRPGALSLTERTLVGGLAAAFPDSDYIVNWIDPLTYLNLHRGITHSLLLLPVWAALLGWILAHVRRRGCDWRVYTMVCALGIAIHIAGDVITVYGTRIFSPVSDLRIAIPTTFIIDPWFTGIIVAGLLASLGNAPRAAARTALASLVLYVGLQGLLHARASALGADYVRTQRLVAARTHALPQPFSPFNWKLIVTSGDEYRVSYVNLLATAPAQQSPPPVSWIAHVRALYQPPDHLQWRHLARFGDDAADDALAHAAWRHPEFRGFRRFAVFPVLYRVDHDKRGICVWFTDLRFVIGAMIPPFRYGMCGPIGTADWHLRQLGRKWGWQPGTGDTHDSAATRP